MGCDSFIHSCLPVSSSSICCGDRWPSYFLDLWFKTCILDKPLMFSSSPTCNAVAGGEEHQLCSRWDSRRRAPGSGRASTDIVDYAYSTVVAAFAYLRLCHFAGAGYRASLNLPMPLYNHAAGFLRCLPSASALPRPSPPCPFSAPACCLPCRQHIKQYLDSSAHNLPFFPLQFPPTPLQHGFSLLALRVHMGSW